MEIIIQSTDDIVTLNNEVRARVWVGKTKAGVPIQCLITRIAVEKTNDLSQFEAELKEQPAPRPESPAYDLRMLL